MSVSIFTCSNEKYLNNRFNIKLDFKSQSTKMPEKLFRLFFFTFRDGDLTCTIFSLSFLFTGLISV